MHILWGVGELNLMIKAARQEQRWVKDVWPVSGGNDLDHVIGAEPIKLAQQLTKHGVLHLPVLGLILTEVLCADGIKLVNEYDCSAQDALGDLLIGKLKHIPYGPLP